LTTTDTTVLDEVAAMIGQVLDDPELTADITYDTTFQEDLGFESLDIVLLGNHLVARYGDAINFPLFLSTLTVDDIIGLRVGDLVDHIRSNV
jgi:acyl carrier protein